VNLYYDDVSMNNTQALIPCLLRIPELGFEWCG
jgi:hypothetical protein